MVAAATLAVGGLAFANGGYFPVSWGWSGVGLLALVGLALALGAATDAGARELLFLGGLAALTAWTALSLLWTSSVPSTVLEVERMLVYLAAGTAGVLLLRRRSAPALLTGIWLAISVVATYGLVARLFPDHFAAPPADAANRLSEPLGYWNAFGILAVVGTLLALGLAARSGPALRAVAAGSSVFLLLALYFTFSRGSWIALFAGLAVAVAVDRRRLQLVTTAALLAPWPALAIWAASSSRALTQNNPSLAQATRDGHGLAAIAIGLAAAAALSALVLDWLETRLAVPRLVRRLYAGALICVLAASLIVVFGRYGWPPTLARKAYDSFGTRQSEHATLNGRLFSLSSSGRNELFRAAWSETRAHPVLGGGAGSYAAYWFAHRPVAITAHDAHNLYLETLAELGPPGLLLLAAALAAPLLVVRRVRAQPLATAALGGYVAFLLHAAVDWDWEMPAVTLCALFCGLVLLAFARGDRTAGRMAPRLRAAALGATAVLASFTVLALAGNTEVSGSSKSLAAGHPARAAAEARRAVHLLSWSEAPWRRLGEAQFVAGDLSAARASFRKAIAKDRRDWTLWLELGQSSAGAARTRALVEAARLNPLGQEIQQEQDRVKNAGR